MATLRCIHWWWRHCSSGMGSTVKSLTSHGTEQIGPREPGQDSSGHGGRSGVGWDDDSPSVKSTPPFEVVSSSGSAPVVGLVIYFSFDLPSRRAGGHSSGSPSKFLIRGTGGRTHGPVRVFLTRDQPVVMRSSTTARGKSGGGAPVPRRWGRVIRVHLRCGGASVFRF